MEGQPHGGALKRAARAPAHAKREGSWHVYDAGDPAAVSEFEERIGVSRERRRPTQQDERSPFASAIVHANEHGLPLPHSLPTHELRENPDNWRRHPLGQLDAIEASIDEVGWIAGATVNLRLEDDGWPSGSQPTMIDGHGRVKVALRRGEAEVPVTWVRLSPYAEAKAVLYFDPITSQAEGDRETFDRLASTIETGSAALQQLLADTRDALAGLDDDEPEPDDEPAEDETGDVPEKFAVVVECADEVEQAALLERLQAEGLNVRALVA